MATSCPKDDIEDRFTRFAKMMLKSFVLLITVIFIITLKKKLLTKDTTLFYAASFCVLGTIVLTIQGLTDPYVFNNIAIGMGIAIGMHVMDI